MKHKLIAALWLASLSPCLGIPAFGQPLQDTPAASVPAPAWTIDQAVTCSVHEAWVLSGKNEEGFFAIVKALAELSAQKRAVTLPDESVLGQRFGEYIKTQARADHDQLLYAIVDRAVRKFGVKGRVTPVQSQP